MHDNCGRWRWLLAVGLLVGIDLGVPGEADPVNHPDKFGDGHEPADRTLGFLETLLATVRSSAAMIQLR